MSSKNQIIEMSAPSNCTLGAFVWGLLDRGFILTITPSKKGARVGGYTVSQKHRTGNYRKLENAKTKFFTQASPKARKAEVR